MLDKKKKKILFLSCVISFFVFVLIFLCFDFFVLYDYNKYGNALRTYISEINEINHGAAKIINNQSIDTKSSKIVLPKAITSLSKMNSDIEKYNVNDKYKSTFNYLNKGLNFNILMYKQLLAIINNPDSPDITTSINNVKIYKNSCNNFYRNIKSKDYTFGLPKESTTLVNNSLTMVSSILRIKRDNTILNTANLEFENSSEDIISKFSRIKCNLYYYAECARKNTMSYDIALGKVTGNQDAFNDLKEQFSGITIPENKVSTYRNLKKVLDDYDSYLNSFITAIKKEKKAASDYSSNDFADLYKDANSKLSLMNRDFTLLKNQQKS